MREQLDTIFGDNERVLNIICMAPGTIERSFKAHNHTSFKGTSFLGRNKGSLFAGNVTADGVPKMSPYVLRHTNCLLHPAENIAHTDTGANVLNAPFITLPQGRVELRIRLPDDSREAWRRILSYSQRDGRPERVILFNSFYTMSRTAAVTLTCIFPMVLVHLPDGLRLCRALLGSLIYAGVILLFLCRWRRFEKRFVEEVYVLFSLQKLEPDRLERKT